MTQNPWELSVGVGSKAIKGSLGIRVGWEGLPEGARGLLPAVSGLAGAGRGQEEMRVDTQGWEQQQGHPRAARTSVPKSQLCGARLSWGTAGGFGWCLWKLLSMGRCQLD